MFRLGKADYFFVTQAAEQLIAAQSAELQARDNYAKALNQFAESTATTLDKYGVRMDEAKEGRVTHRDVPPPAAPISTPTPAAGNIARNLGE